jgi:tetratricopeptide (TPR) repeat protein
MYAYNPNRKGIAEVQILKLETHRLYPPKNQLNDEFLRRPKPQGLKINRDTPIASIGSCFAREIKFWLRENNYNYLQLTTGPCTEAGSARYDRVYNTFSIRQEVERAFGKFNPVCTHWRFEEDGKERWLDPHRHCVAWEDEADMLGELEEHNTAVHRAFTEAKVIIITVGQGEIWFDKRDNTVFPMAPPTKVFDRDIHAFRMSTFGENFANLQRTYDLIKEHNPGAHLIVTVSPVPLLATFQDRNSVEANCGSKSMLRAVVDEFVRSHGDDVSYFPAYEVVTCTNEDPFQDDARHVQRSTVDTIMGLFEHRFLKPSERVSDETLVHLGNEALNAGQWAISAGHFEELTQRIMSHKSVQSHPLWGCINQINQALGEVYMQMARYQDAYTVLKDALNETQSGTPRYYHLLNQVAALAIDLQDVDDVSTYMELILKDKKAPIDLFLHYVTVAESWYNYDAAAALLANAKELYPRIQTHADYAKTSAHFGILNHRPSALKDVSAPDENTIQIRESKTQ